MELGTDNFILRTMGERYLWNREGKQKSNLSQTLFLPSPSGNAQMLSAVIQTKTGGLVVDGGWEPDGDKGARRSCDSLAAHSLTFRSRRGALRNFKESGVRTPNRPYLLFLLGSAVI